MIKRYNGKWNAKMCSKKRQSKEKKLYRDKKRSHNVKYIKEGIIYLILRNNIIN